MNAHARQPLVYNGTLIADKGETLSLTDMWKACGSPLDERPDDWKSISGHAEFIDHVAAVLNTAPIGIWKGTRGRHGGGTMAHWHIGLAYAQWIDHDIHIWCNNVVRAVMEGKANSSLSPELAALIERTDGIVRQMHHKVTGIEKSNADLHQTVHRLEAKLAEAETSLRRKGITSLQVWDKYGLPPRIRGRCQWLTCRLIRLGAGIDFNGRADVGNTAVHLFDPDKVDYFMKQAGLLLQARTYAAEKLGQGKLNLKGKSR